MRIVSESEANMEWEVKAVSRHLRKCAIVSIALLAATNLTSAESPTVDPDASKAKPIVPVNRNVLPPKEFDHEFDGTVIVFRFDTPEKLKAWCNNPTMPKPYIACAKHAKNEIGNWCYIGAISNAQIEAQGWTWEIVRRHELGHCANWPANHPGARTPEEYARDKR